MSKSPLAEDCSHVEASTKPKQFSTYPTNNTTAIAGNIINGCIMARESCCNDPNWFKSISPSQFHHPMTVDPITVVYVLYFAIMSAQ